MCLYIFWEKKLIKFIPKKNNQHFRFHNSCLNNVHIEQEYNTMFSTGEFCASSLAAIMQEHKQTGKCIILDH